MSGKHQQPVSGPSAVGIEATTLHKPQSQQASVADRPTLADLHQAEGLVRWRDSLRDWTLAALFATGLAFAGRYVNGLLEGFSPEGTSWL